MGINHTVRQAITMSSYGMKLGLSLINKIRINSCGLLDRAAYTP